MRDGQNCPVPSVQDDRVMDDVGTVNDDVSLNVL